MSDIERRCRKAYDEHGVSSVIWNVTSSCDLKCKHCYIGDNVDTSKELDEKEARQLVNRLGDIGVPLLFMTGGEPLLRDDIFDIIENCRDNNITTVLSSNGLLLEEDKVRDLKRHEVHFNAVSLYGPKKVHDDVVGLPGSYEKIMRGVQNCIENDINVCFKTVVSNYTYPHIPYIIEKGLDMGVKAFYLCDLIEAGRAEGAAFWRISTEQWVELADHLFQKVIVRGEAEIDIGGCPSIGPLAIEYFSKRDRDVSHAHERLRSMSACPVGKGPISINARGDVLPCNFMQDYPLGNIREKSISELAQHPVLRSLADKENISGKCGDCKYKIHCMGCRAKAYINLGDIEGEDRTCIVNFGEN